MTLALHVQTYLTHKLGNERHECEDAIAFSLAKGTFAVADGATEAFDSRFWSRLLVKTWVRRPSQKSLFLKLVNQLGQRAAERWGKKQLPWYAEEKAKAGSFAAFVGATFETVNTSMQWHVVAIGDSCFIQTRRGEVIFSVPLSDPEHFGFRPTLLPSKGSAQLLAADQLQEHQGIAESGDRFFLLSDAVASWFLGGKQKRAAGTERFEDLLSKGMTNELDIFFDEQRADSSMRNDDIAALYLEVVQE
jgi:Protein phosphatase 2C